MRVPEGPVWLSSPFSILISNLYHGELVKFAGDLEQRGNTGTLEVRVAIKRIGKRRVPESPRLECNDVKYEAMYVRKDRKGLSLEWLRN